MAPPKAVYLSEGARGYRVEYIRARGVLRIAGWLSGRQVVPPIEASFAELVDQLGIDTPPTGPYMLFGGSSVAGGSRDFLGAYPTEHAARRAFTELRTSTFGGWGEVVHVVRDRLVQVCWYGHREREPRREVLRGFLRRG